MNTKVKIHINIQDKHLKSGICDVLSHISNFFEIVDDSNDSELILTEMGETNFDQTPAILNLSTYQSLRSGAVLKMAYQRITEKYPIKTIGDMIFDPNLKHITQEAWDSPITLTDLEVSILNYLDIQSPDYVTKEDLLKNVWDYQQGVTTHTVETHIYRLRQKIPDLEQYLLTTAQGYVLK